MKIIYRITFPAIFFGILIFLLFKIKININQKRAVKSNVQVLKSFDYKSLTMSYLKIDLESTKRKVIIFFNSECEHCQSEARLIINDTNVTAVSDVYFFSSEEIPKIKQFYLEYLNNSPKINIGQVTRDVGLNHFGVNTYPYVFVYDSDNTLLKTFKGEVKIEALSQ